MKRMSTLFLRGMILLFGAVILAGYIFILPRFLDEAADTTKLNALQIFLPSILLYATAIPFYFALFQTFRLLILIDRREAFSLHAVTALMYIKRAATVFCGQLTLSLPLFYALADVTDAPGVLLFAIIITLAPAAIATFAAVLETLLREAIAIKAENDLVV